MAYPLLRSMTAELATGASDGRYKKIVTNRGGFPDAATYEARSDLHDVYFGIHETDEKELPGMLSAARTQAYRDTPRAEPWH